MTAYGDEAWDALADHTRRAIVERLAERPRAVGELAGQLPVTRPAISQHLKVLKDAGLVVERAAGTRRIYRLDPTGVAALRDELDTFWSRVLAGYKDTRRTTTRGAGMHQIDTTVIRREIVVDAPVERAFAVFTERFGDFKPPEHNLLGAPITETIFEPHVGGHIYDRAQDGTECRWARILAYEPPHRLLFSWNITPHWQLESDPDHTSEVEIHFLAETEQRTRVELEHRHLDRHGPGWQSLGHAIGGDAGWPLYLSRYADVVTEGR